MERRSRAGATFRIDLVSPQEGPIDGGITVRIDGAGFTDQTAFYFGDGLADRLAGGDATSVEVDLPPAMRGRSVDVVAINPGQSAAVLAAGFRYIDPNETPTPPAPPRVEIDLDVSGGVVCGSGFVGLLPLAFVLAAVGRRRCRR